MFRQRSRGSTRMCAPRASMRKSTACCGSTRRTAWTARPPTCWGRAGRRGKGGADRSTSACSGFVPPRYDSYLRDSAFSCLVAPPAHSYFHVSFRDHHLGGAMSSTPTVHVVASARTSLLTGLEERLGRHARVQQHSALPSAKAVHSTDILVIDLDDAAE